MHCMAMGRRKRDRQVAMWITTTELPTAASHPFYRRLNQLLREHGFDDFAEAQCGNFYAETIGRPSLPPGIYFRLLLVGYFEGIDSERGIAWRVADSLALRDCLGVGLDEAPPDHSTISRTRRLIDLETHRAVFTWVLQCLSAAGLVKGNTIGIDATTLEANAALRSIVRRDTGEGYEEFLTKLAKGSGIGTPTRADLARIEPEAQEEGLE
jgi:transposase